MRLFNETFPKGYLRTFSAVENVDEMTQLLAFGTWPHPIWGDVVLDKPKAERMKANFDNNVVGRKITYDYEHKLSSAHGTKAAAELVEVEVRDDGLYGKLEWTPQAKKEIGDKEWLYTSPEYVDVFKKGDEKIEDVLVGGALTNTPVIYGIAPVNCSAIMPTATPEGEYADWEHSEPGTGQPPAPATEQTETDPTPPSLEPKDPQDKGVVEVDEKELREKLGIAEEVDIMAHLDSVLENASAFQEAAKAASQVSDFEKQFPEQAAALKALGESNKENAAKAFSAQWLKNGIPPVVIEKIEESHKKLSAVPGGVEALTEVLESMPKIKYNEETGVATTTRTAAQESMDDDPRKAFAALQGKIAAEETDGNMRKAMSLAASREPELFAAASNHKVPNLTVAG